MPITSQAKESEEVKDGSVAETTKSVVSGIVKFGKDLLEGIDEGIDDGRKTGLSQDGAIIVNNVEDLEKYLVVNVINVNKDNNSISYVELGFNNKNNRPVRLVNLKESENIIAIDASGYATNLLATAKNISDVTVPSNAGKKQKFYFELNTDSIKEIRIMGKTLSI